MRILVDADGRPVVDSTIVLAKAHHIECLLLCDTSHVFERDGARTLTFSKGADSVDFALVNLVQSGDLVVTQDYGLAAMCLARNAVVLSQDGMGNTQRTTSTCCFCSATRPGRSATPAGGSRACSSGSRSRTSHLGRS